MSTPENKCEKYCCDGECNHDACCGKITENCKIDCDCHKDTPETMEEKSEKITRDILDVIWPNSFNVSISPIIYFTLKSVISLAISSHNKELIEKVEEVIDEYAEIGKMLQGESKIINIEKIHAFYIIKSLIKDSK